MLNREMLAGLTPEEMPNEELKEMAVLIGVELTLKLIFKFRARNVHFPVFWQQNVVQKWVSFKFDGANYKELAADLGVSEDTIYRATKAKAMRGPWKRPRPQSIEQTTLLPMEDTDDRRSS